MEKQMHSLWWYRKRALVIGAIYLAGFLITAPDRSVARSLGTSGFAAVVLLMLACWLVRAWGSSYLRSSTVWNPDALDDAFITAGPFAYTRNPLYLGNVLMALGLGALASPAGWVVINIANMAFVVLLINWEERGMRARYREQFAAYCARVPRLFPRFTPFRPSRGEPSLAQGLRAEIFTSAILAGTIAIAVAPLYYGWSVFAALYVFGIGMQTLLARKAALA